MKQPDHPMNQQQLNTFTSSDPTGQMVAQAVALPSIQTEREPTISNAQRDDGNTRHRCGEEEVPCAHIPVLKQHAVTD